MITGTHGGKVEIVKGGATGFPYRRAPIFLLAFLYLQGQSTDNEISTEPRTIKPIHLCNLPALVVPAQKSDFVWIPDDKIQEFI